MFTWFCTTGNRWPLTSTNLWKEKGREFKYKSSQCEFQVACLHTNLLQGYISTQFTQKEYLLYIHLHFNSQ